MNIGEAKEEMKRTVEIYLDTNAYGEYTIPYRKQRPILMTGAPGIGKTAVVEQIASEMDIGLVACSLTHYTKQGALGLPYMTKREYGGRVWQISEYTMSEILLAVYEVMEESGRRRGILFLDEIDGVPEALAPAIRSLLQNKKLGGKSLPEGWVIAAAATPARYGDGMKKLDIAMLDRLKRLEVEADLAVWKTYAYRQAVHAAVTAFLDIHQDCFYSLCADGGDWEYVTARGWEDLSGVLRMYEKKGFQVDDRLILQYIGSRETGNRFRKCYQMFLKCREKYPVGDILRGSRSPGLAESAAEAGAEERTVLSHMLLERLNLLFAEAMGQEAVRRRAGRLLRTAKRQSEEEQLPLYAILYTFLEQLREERRKRQAANSLSLSLKEEFLEEERLLTGYLETIRREGDLLGQQLQVKKECDALAGKGRKQAGDVKEALERGISFLEEAWGRGQELESFRRELAANPFSSSFGSAGDGSAGVSGTAAVAE